MDGEQDRPEGVVPETPGWVVPAPKKKGRGAGVFFLRLVLGAAVSFTVLSLLYGVNQAGLIVGLAVVCTAGLGLIPILFLCWIVGWIVLAAAESIATDRGAASVP
jgi:hypothetical protein